MTRTGPGPVAALGFGVGFVLAALALLLQEFDVLTLRWSVVLPLIVMAVGLVVVLSALIGAHRNTHSGGGPTAA
jgi:cytochrome c oxidase subunit IV